METLIVKPADKEQLVAVKAILKLLKVDFVSCKESTYDPEFVQKINSSRAQAKKGKVMAINAYNLWK